MSIKRIRAVDRALLVIEVLSQSGSCSLTELRQKTGLDNAGLLRILGTMIDRGWVRQLIVEKRYELSHSLGDILGAEARAHPMAEIAVPILLELRQNPYSLPSDLCAIRGFGQFEIIESTRLRGPMAPGRTGLGLQPSLFQSAHGRVILAHMSDEMREKHIEAFLNRARKEDIIWYNSGRLDAELETTINRGYGIREELYWEPRLMKHFHWRNRGTHHHAGWNSRITKPVVAGRASKRKHRHSIWSVGSVKGIGG